MFLDHFWNQTLHLCLNDTLQKVPITGIFREQVFYPLSPLPQTILEGHTDRCYDFIVKLQSSLTVQSKSVGLEVDFVLPRPN